MKENIKQPDVYIYDAIMYLMVVVYGLAFFIWPFAISGHISDETPFIFSQFGMHIILAGYFLGFVFAMRRMMAISFGVLLISSIPWLIDGIVRKIPGQISLALFPLVVVTTLLLTTLFISNKSKRTSEN